MAEHGEAGCQISGSPRQEPEADIRVIRLPGKRLGVAVGLLARRKEAMLLPGDNDGAERRLVPKLGLRGQGVGGALRSRWAAELDHDAAPSVSASRRRRRGLGERITKGASA